ncbi:META domain-containing protein [Confluentibacter flavum]|uniref:DUF306 domain-containing protein n=1 Tax=Confluentibacter flavum TaxID=1909700 RepID=A0A2N3HPD5_9FLAO|nr:META domain-containing protein [Confluentibacter flavum]PKQ46853.1 hypothetical protein CSW08_00645 [Confluentibacter flavum]
MKFLVILSFLISLKACNLATKTATLQENNSNNLMAINGIYDVKTLNDNDVIANKLTIDFNSKEQRISGFSGCNRFIGSYSLETDSIRINLLASTKMFCGDTANQMEFEMQEALSITDKIILNDSILQFLSNKKVLLTAIKKNDNIAFNYSAMSRGRFLDIIVNDSILSISKDREAKPISKAITKENWKKLNSLLETITLDSIATLKSPTEARFYDGASIGTLKISKNGTVYESSNFDHGTPPLAIEALVKEILSLSENVD